MKSYALTIKWNTNPNPTRIEYMQCISDLLNMFSKILVFNWAFEPDKKNKIHLHVHIKCRYIHWKKFLEKYNAKGFHVNVQELKKQEDCDKWDSYLNKHRLSPHECEQINDINDIYQQEYPFVEQEVDRNLINDNIKDGRSLGYTEHSSECSDESKMPEFVISFD